MKAIVAILILLSVSMGVSASQFKESRSLFTRFQHKYGKIYSSAQEFDNRYKIFSKNLETIRQLNEMSSDAKYGITKFADLTSEEFRGKYLMPNFKSSVADELKTAESSNAALPDSWDWRQQSPYPVTAVKNQEQCGSCWAFSTTEAIESAWIMAGKGTNMTVDLAPQQIVDCDTSDDGCNGGDPPTAYEYVIKAGGLEPEADYPYTAQDGTCKFDKNDVAATISSWKYGTTKGDENTMQQNLYSVGPLSICVDAASWQFYVGGIVREICGQTLDHCVELVGYNAAGSTHYWIVRNSWGEDWGEQGYIWVEMGKNLCGITNECTYPIV